MLHTSGIVGFVTLVFRLMGRSSNAKKQRRAQRARVVVAPAKAKGGRPRVHENAAARTRAWRLRKKSGLDTIPGEAGAEPDETITVDWFDSSNYLEWLADGERRLGPDWLATQLELDAEIVFAERGLA